MTDTKQQRLLDADSATRKTFPMFSGLLAYFPDALAYVAWVSHVGNEKHNPGEPMHHARGKSKDHADCIVRHVTRHGEFDGEVRESGALAWRALALLQEELEQAHGFGLPRGARPAKVSPEPPGFAAVKEAYFERVRRDRAALAAAIAARVAHNADPNTRHGVAFETKFGFTVGETVNVVGCEVGRNPGVVVGFTNDRIKVRWFGMRDNEFGNWHPSELRHGA